MKTAIKIILPLIGLIVVGIVIFYTFKDNKGEGKLKTDTYLSAFVDNIKKDASKDIPEVGENAFKFSTVYGKFKSLRDQIETDYKLSGGSVSKTEYENAMKILVDRYCAWFGDKCDKFFQSSSWDSSNMDDIKTSCKALQQTKLIQQDSQNGRNLSMWITTVDNYKAAKHLISSSSSYHSISDSKSKIKRASALKTGLLLNNSEIVSGLDDVEDNLYYAHLEYVRKKLNSVTDRDIDSFGTYSRFVDAYLAAKNAVSNLADNADVYGRGSYSVNSSLQDELNSLEWRDDYASWYLP